MTKPNTATITQTIVADPEDKPIFLIDAEISFDVLECKISDMLESKISDMFKQHKKEFALEMGTHAHEREIEPLLCLNDGAPCIKIFLESAGIYAHAYIPIASLAYPFDTFENFDPQHNGGRHGRDAEMVAVGVTDRAALAAALRTLADNVAADPVPPQSAHDRAPNKSD